jgi:hypothetical protein
MGFSRAADAIAAGERAATKALPAIEEHLNRFTI